MTDEKLTHQEISRRGGIASAKTRTKEVSIANGKKASATMREKYGDDYYKKLRQKGIEKKNAQQTPLARLITFVTGKDN